MSNDIRPIWLLSEDELFNWLETGPRTYNWQVMVALDRDKTNQLLMQEYIQRYSKDLYFDPITDTVEISDSDPLVWEHLYNHVLGPPRLSFENSNNDEWARLTMPILGGTQLTVAKVGGGPKHVTRISWYSPLQAPRLICEIRLEDTGGEVDYGGKVYLDLRRGTNFRLTFASTYQAQLAGGEFYEEIFQELDEELRWFQLGTLNDYEDGAALQPDKFRLRALSAQPAKEGEKEGTQEGALLMFVGTKGNPVGQVPDKGEEWVYPIPAGRSSTMLVSNSVIMAGLIRRGFETSSAIDKEFELIEGGPIEGVIGIRFTKGRLVLSKYDVPIPGYDRTVEILGRFSLYGNDDGEDVIEFKVVRVGEDVVMSWAVDFDASFSATVGLVGDGGVGVADVRTKWNLENPYHFVVDGATGAAKLEPRTSAMLDVTSRLNWITQSLEPHLDEVMRLARDFTEEIVVAFQKHVANGIQEMELFRVYGLIFNGSNVVKHQSVRLPLDLAVFGDISPTQTTYQLDPVEKDVIHGGSIQFTVVPPQTGLSWKLDAVPGFAGSLGTITQSGAYTAPSAVEIPAGQAYTMVRVTATNGSLTSSALVKVVRRSIILNPLVVSANKGSKKVKFSAGALAEGKLEWSVDSRTGATLTDTPPDEDDPTVFDEGDMFYIPGPDSTGEPFSIDTITVTDTAGNSASSHLVLLEGTVPGSIVIKEDAGLPEGKIKLGLDLGSGPMPDEQVTWRLLAGGGSIDATGIYTMDLDSDWPYAVIAGSFEVPPHVYLPGYIILPIPLVDLGEIRRVLG